MQIKILSEDILDFFTRRHHYSVGQGDKNS